MKILKTKLGKIILIAIAGSFCFCSSLAYVNSPTYRTTATAQAALTKTAAFTLTPTDPPAPTKTHTPPPVLPTFTQVPTETEPSPTETWPAAAAPGSIEITTIYYDGTGQDEPDEYVAIKNTGSDPIQLKGWKLSDAANHTYIFPEYLIQPGETCRIYTDENHPETCGFNYRQTGSAIWNNSGDTATLKDPSGAVVDTYQY